MRRSLFEDERLRHVCDLRTLQEVLRHLYPSRETEDHISLERALTEDHISQLVSLSKHLSGSALECYTWFLRYYQLQNLKLVFNCWKNREERSVLVRYLPNVPEMLALPVSKLMAASDIRAFAEMLPVSEFGRAIERAVGSGESDEGISFRVQAELDRAYFIGLRDVVGRIGTAQRRNVRRLTRLQRAIHDTVLLARVKCGYSPAVEDVLRPLMAPERIARDQMREAADGVSALIPRSLRLPAEFGEREILKLERALRERMHRAANRVFYSAEVGLGIVLAFSYIKRTELANIIRLIELVRAGASGRVIRDSMIPALQSELAYATA